MGAGGHWGRILVAAFLFGGLTAGPVAALTITPAEIAAGALIWDPTFASLVYTYIGDGRHLIEAAVPLAELNATSGGRQPPRPPERRTFNAQWTTTRGDDKAQRYGSIEHGPPENIVPEPATCTLLGGSLLAALALRVRKRGKKHKGGKRA